MKKLRRLYYKYFPKDRILETIFVSYSKADFLLRTSYIFTDESNKWVLAKEEDNNHQIGMVYLCRKERITE